MSLSPKMKPSESTTSLIEKLRSRINNRNRTIKDAKDNEITMNKDDY